MIENSIGPITQELLHTLFYYDTDTGKLINKVTRSSRAEKGFVAGCVVNYYPGLLYILIRINNKAYLAHRLIWLYHYGYIDNNKQMDHINGNTLDNRLENLRLVTDLENKRNKSLQKNNISGANGVFRDKKYNKWCCKIKVKSRDIFGGYFTKKKDAIKKRRELEKKYGFHENHGRAKCLT